VPLDDPRGRSKVALDDRAPLHVSLGLSSGLIGQRTGVFAVHRVAAGSQFAYDADSR
jgi:hypothetical protein